MGGPGTQCHHIVVEDWARMQEPHGTLFVSIPSLLDPSLCPPGTHIVHMFTPDWMDNWQVRPAAVLRLPTHRRCPGLPGLASIARETCIFSAGCPCSAPVACWR